MCPLRDVQPLISPLGADTVLGEMLSAAEDVGNVSSTMMLQLDDAAKIRSRDAIQEAIKQATEKLNQRGVKFSERLSRASVRDVLSLVGIDADFATQELKMIDSLTTGKAIIHHLEPSYYAAMQCALEAADT